jgi:hypothetical protein
MNHQVTNFLSHQEVVSIFFLNWIDIYLLINDIYRCGKSLCVSNTMNWINLLGEPKVAVEGLVWLIENFDL